MAECDNAIARSTIPLICNNSRAKTISNRWCYLFGCSVPNLIIRDLGRGIGNLSHRHLARNSIIGITCEGQIVVNNNLLAHIALALDRNCKAIGEIHGRHDQPELRSLIARVANSNALRAVERDCLIILLGSAQHLDCRSIAIGCRNSNVTRKHLVSVALENDRADGLIRSVEFQTKVAAHVTENEILIALVRRRCNHKISIQTH